MPTLSGASAGAGRAGSPALGPCDPSFSTVREFISGRKLALMADADGRISPRMPRVWSQPATPAAENRTPLHQQLRCASGCCQTPRAPPRGRGCPSQRGLHRAQHETRCARPGGPPCCSRSCTAKIHHEQHRPLTATGASPSARPCAHTGALRSAGRAGEPEPGSQTVDEWWLLPAPRDGLENRRRGRLFEMRRAWGRRRLGAGPCESRDGLAGSAGGLVCWPGARK